MSIIHKNPYKKEKGGGRRKAVAVNGFRSKFENRINKKVPSKYIHMVEYEKEKIPYIIEHTYNPDFVIKKENGEKVYIEAKGYFSKDDRRKMLAVKKQHPELDIRLLFQKASNKIGGNSKKKYSDWCDINGFKWAEGDEIPKEWFEWKK